MPERRRAAPAAAAGAPAADGRGTAEFAFTFFPRSAAKAAAAKADSFRTARKGWTPCHAVLGNAAMLGGC